MTQKVVLITGGNSGLGKAAATELARLGLTVVIAARNAERGGRACDEIRAETGGDVHWVPLDLASLASVRRCAAAVLERFDRLDVLVNNAGVLLSTRTETEDGFETTFGVNHLGHFLLTALLLDRLRASAPSRVVTVSSTLHWMVFGLDFADLQATRRYDGMAAYASSKLANVLFTRELARRLEGTGVTANSLCPGLVASSFASDGDTSGMLQMIARMSRPLAVSPSFAAQTPVYLATAPSLDGVSGQHYVFRMPAPVSWMARDAAAARRLWEISEALVAAPAARAAAP
jgi:NAD(P)-dependent dehydrogenase (short-subunit alcohol dehydrogenase family)